MYAHSNPYLVPEVRSVRIYEKIVPQRDTRRTVSPSIGINSKTAGISAKCTTGSASPFQVSLKRNKNIVNSKKPNTFERYQPIVSTTASQALRNILANAVSTSPSGADLFSKTSKLQHSQSPTALGSDQHSLARPLYRQGSRPTSAVSTKKSSAASTLIYHEPISPNDRQQTLTEEKSREQSLATANKIYKRLHGNSLTVSNESQRNVTFSESIVNGILVTRPVGLQGQQVQNIQNPRLCGGSTAAQSAFQTLGYEAPLMQNTWKNQSEGINPSHSNSVSIPRKDMVIHVYDEARNVMRDFHCKKSLLLREMKYFESCLSEKTLKADIIEIDVHCDVHVFEWLILFITKQQVQLDSKTVVSILISSSFLQMSSLEETCLEYIHAQINSIIDTCVDFKCIGQLLMGRLAKLFQPDELHHINDTHDKIKSQLYLIKIGELMQTQNGLPAISSCTACGKVYASNKHQSLQCDMAKVSIDYHGEITTRHTINGNFDLYEYIVAMYISVNSWEMVYWRIWGYLNHMTCSSCHKIFALVNFNKCQTHETETSDQKQNGSNQGEYRKHVHACCNDSSVMFMPFNIITGCKLVNHVAVVDDSTVDIYNLFQRHIDRVVWHKRGWSQLNETEKDSEAAAMLIPNMPSSESVVNLQQSVSRGSRAALELDHLFGLWPGVESDKNIRPSSSESSESGSTGSIRGSQSNQRWISASSRPNWRDSLTEHGASKVYTIKHASQHELEIKPKYIQRSDDVANMQSLMSELQLLRG
ncbi:hypothetical protein BDV3_002724 [Batrachochytrium dendrobatidis]